MHDLTKMNELTMDELDAELAEQLPARELMNVRITGGNFFGGNFNSVGDGSYVEDNYGIYIYG